VCVLFYNVKFTRYLFDAPDAHFDSLYLFSDAQPKKIGNPKYYDCKNPNRLP
jgi:hypothetical protein